MKIEPLYSHENFITSEIMAIVNSIKSREFENLYIIWNLTPFYKEH